MDDADDNEGTRYQLTGKALMLLLSDELSQASRLAAELSDLDTPVMGEPMLSEYWEMVTLTQNISGLLTILMAISQTWPTTSSRVLNSWAMHRLSDGT